jgi:non-ribosomal peptide synthetase component F
MKNRIEENMRFVDFLKELSKDVIESYQNQDYPFEMLVEQLNWPMEKGRNPLFDTLFVMQSNNSGSGIPIEGLTINQVDREVTDSKFDIFVNCYEVEVGIRFEMNYSTRLYKEETIIRFSKDYLTIMARILHDSNVKIENIEL